MEWLKTSALLLLMFPPLPARAEAPPVEFGLEELRRAVRERKLNERYFRIRADISMADPETFRIVGRTVTGGDLRGLMYGLLTAAEQIRRYGYMVSAGGKPAVPIRGIRRFLHNRDLEQDWYYSGDYWTQFFRMLARNRFNRFNLVFAHQTDYLAPPYPYWVAVEQFPQVHVPGLSDEQRARNLNALCSIAQKAADHAIDFTLGIWEHDVQKGMTPSVHGLNENNIGPYTYAALRKVLAACPAIRSVQVRTNSESGIPPHRQLEFYRDYVYRAIRDAGRLVTLDLRGWLMKPGMLEAAAQSGVPLRLSSKYWAEHLGRPYPPAETYPNYSYLDFLRRPRSYTFFWEIWALGSHRLLLWGDPDYVRRAVPTLTLADSAGFEIDAPLAQMGFGNRPGKWSVFTPQHQDKIFWMYDFERYWLFYLLWGRLTYDPKTSPRAWTDEFKRRFGLAAADVLELYQHASRVLNELVAVHMPDPNMYMWPEINPGGLIDYYIAAPPGDRRFVASITEAVRNRIAGIPSAKQTPRRSARRFAEMADAIEQAIQRAAAKIPPNNREWRGSLPDFRVLAALARFHAHRRLAADQLAFFYQTGDREALHTARQQTAAALKTWERLVELTAGLYPARMAFGPEDTGHWKDKLVYLRHDLKTLDEREWILDRFGRFDHGFDFGAPPPARRVPPATVEPRFRPVDPATDFTEERGYGWAVAGERYARPLEEPPRQILRATAFNPHALPENALFGDSIRGRGAQTFRVRTGPGEFLVSFLYPDGNAQTETLHAAGGVLDILMPAADWDISGLLVKSLRPDPKSRPKAWREPAKRPTFTHVAPSRARARSPLNLLLRVSPPSAAETVRLHYRPLNQLEKFRTLEAPAAHAAFTVPAEELTGEFDLMYYFEILDKQGTGWFYPDPETSTPYRVVEIQAPR